MTPIQLPTPPVFDPAAAYVEMCKKHCNGKVIGYRTRSRDTMVALLTCLSDGGKRAVESVKPTTPLWGFVYLNEPGHEPRFVRNSAIESIQMALGQGSPVALWDSIGELFNPVKHATRRPEPEFDPDVNLAPELSSLIDQLYEVHHAMVRKGHDDYALGPYRTRGLDVSGQPPGWFRDTDGYTKKIPKGPNPLVDKTLTEEPE